MPSSLNIYSSFQYSHFSTFSRFKNGSFRSFAVLSDPIKRFDGLDHTYPLEKFFVHLTARVTFQLGPHDTPWYTEPKFEINMYHSNTSSCSQSSDNQANAITPSTWFVNLYIFKPPEDTSLPSKLELLDRGASICVLNTPLSQTVLNVLIQLLKMMNLKHLQPLIKLKTLFYFI